MVKIHSKNWKSREINLPEVGKVSFNEKGEAEIDSKEHAQYLVSIESLQLELVGKASTPNSNSDTSSGKTLAQMNKSELIAKAVEMGRDYEDLTDKKNSELRALIAMSDEEFNEKYPSIKEEVEEEEEEVEVSKEDKIAYINSLDKMNDLKQLAAAFDETEWVGIKSKAKLKEYLISKI